LFSFIWFDEEWVRDTEDGGCLLSCKFGRESHESSYTLSPAANAIGRSVPTSAPEARSVWFLAALISMTNH
jgi:hypothetical protein